MKFRKNGLRWNDTFINDAKVKIGTYELNRQLTYCDKECYDNHANQEWVNNYIELLKKIDQSKFEGLDATMIGNIALIANLSKDKETKKFCYDYLNQYKQWAIGWIQQQQIKAMEKK